jgi:tRNA A37 threonylcarbamoyladenosine modification protein TsaB
MLKFISVDSTLNSLIITSNINKKKTIKVKNYLKSDNFSKDFSKILKENDINLDEARLLLVNLGPGSFVGIRNILSCLKVLSLIKSIKIVGFCNDDLWSIVKTNKKIAAYMIMYFNKKFLSLQSKFKVIKMDEFDRIISNNKVVSNYEYNGIFKKNIVPFVYGFKEVETLIQKKLFYKKDLNPMYEMNL